MYIDKEVLELNSNFSEGTSTCHLWYKYIPIHTTTKGLVKKKHSSGRISQHKEKRVKRLFVLKDK